MSKLHEIIFSLGPEEYFFPKLSSLPALFISEIQLKLTQRQCHLVAIFQLNVVPPGAQNLISLSPLRGAPTCEVTWLWVKYILLYRGRGIQKIQHFVSN